MHEREGSFWNDSFKIQLNQMQTEEQKSNQRIQEAKSHQQAQRVQECEAILRKSMKRISLQAET